MTNLVEMAKIQDRVQKLLNMAKDASSPNEAMIAMERARRLMDKYQIEETDLEQVEENRFGGGQSIRQTIQIHACLDEHHGDCSMQIKWRSRGRNLW